MDKDTLWNQTKELMLDGVADNELKSVFLNLITPLGIFGNSVVFIAQNAQVKDWILDHYISEMEACMQAVSGMPLTVGIGTTDETTSQPREERDASPTPADTASPQENAPSWMFERVRPGDIAEPAHTTGADIAQTTSANTHRSARNEALFSKCTFDTFVKGNSNEFARAAAISVADNPGGAYNPLFIYGNSGLGKTHLLVAIANYTMSNTPELKVLYTTANEFLNDYVTATQNNYWTPFNTRYHDMDILLMDDVQYLEKKTESINQLFNIFNDMTSRNKQIVLSADRAPKDINMDERMRSRFTSGLSVDIKPPDYETRLAILKNYVSYTTQHTNFYGIITSDILEYIAETSTSNIREIEGAVTRLITNMSIFHRDSITVDEAKEILKDFFPDNQKRKVEISTIMKEVEQYFGVSHEDMVSKSRARSITYPRHIAVYLSRYLTEESLESIGKKFGGRNHTTIMSSISKIEQDQKGNKTLLDQIEQLTKNIKEHS